MKKILLIEDDINLIQVIGDRLRANNYNFFYKDSGEEGLKTAISGNFDLILVDLMLPGSSGFDIIRELRNRGFSEPIIIVSAKFQVADKIKGLNIGADDYIVKPFDFEELLARIDAHIRRDSLSLDCGIKGDDWFDEKHENISFGEYYINFKLCEALKNGKVITMSKMEFRLLSYLVLNRDRVIRVDELLEKVWNYEEPISVRTLYVHIAWLRKKIYSNYHNYIKTVRGVGYRFDLDTTNGS